MCLFFSVTTPSWTEPYCLPVSSCCTSVYRGGVVVVFVVVVVLVLVLSVLVILLILIAVLGLALALPRPPPLLRLLRTTAVPCRQIVTFVLHTKQ